MTVHALVPKCFELFRRQNIQNFLGLCTSTTLGRAYSIPQTPQLHCGSSPHYTHQKTGTPRKLLDTALQVPGLQNLYGIQNVYRYQNLCIFFCFTFLKPTSNILVFADMYLHKRHKKERPRSIFSPTIHFKLKNK